MEGEGRSWEKACPHTPAWSTWGKQAALGSPRIPEDPASPATGPPAEKPGLSRAPVSCRPRPTFHLPLPKFSSTGPPESRPHTSWSPNCPSGPWSCPVAPCSLSQLPTSAAGTEGAQPWSTSHASPGDAARSRQSPPAELHSILKSPLVHGLLHVLGLQRNKEKRTCQDARVCGRWRLPHLAAPATQPVRPHPPGWQPKLGESLATAGSSRLQGTRPGLPSSGSSGTVAGGRPAIPERGTLRSPGEQSQSETRLSDGRSLLSNS